MSSNVKDAAYAIRHEFYLRDKYHRTNNRIAFLEDCLDEQVLPRSAPSALLSDEHPFTDAARAYLEEGIKSLRHRLVVLKSRFGEQLPRDLAERLLQGSAKHRANLQNKLARLCSSSKWQNAGNPDLINNMSGRALTDIEIQALSLGLKFNIGKSSQKYIDLLAKNNKFGDSDIDKGFKQGVTTCLAALACSNRSALPRRYLQAMQNLSKDDTIVITSADKGGGIVILDKTTYIDKMQALLCDVSTYKHVTHGTCKKSADRFSKEARKILRRSERGKQLLYLLEEDPKPPAMRGLPKTHKPGIPMRPITSGVGSAPHRLAKTLAKPLSNALGSISPSHLKNSGDLLNRIKDININGKKIVSFDVKALFTNVPVDGAMAAVKRVTDNVTDDDLPMPKEDFMKLIHLCVSFNVFQFDGKEYEQVKGLAMGSPLSAVLACLYMEAMEEDHYKNIVGNNCTWLRYVDDVLCFVPSETDLPRLLQELNNIDAAIQFTTEEENNGKIPFLDTLILRDGERLKFTVYRKPTYKNDLVHYFSAHSQRVKSGVVIGFFLRAFRICSEDLLQNEINFIMRSFLQLRYPLAELISCQEKAKKILSRAGTTTNRQSPSDKPLPAVIVPHSVLTEPVQKILRSSLSVITVGGKKLGNVLKSKKMVSQNKKSVVYKIPCGKCPRVYYGETGRGMETRIREHKADLRYHRPSNAFVAHVDEEGHLPNWSGATSIQNLTKSQRKVIEAAFIASGKNINTSTGFFRLASVAAALITQKYDKFSQ